MLLPCSHIYSRIKYPLSLPILSLIVNSISEFFFHAMGGREGLIDTAVKTAETGKKDVSSKLFGYSLS